jgi:hypothetical protein
VRAVILALLLSGCGTEIVELLPDGGASRDAEAVDLGFTDSGVRDVGFPDDGIIDVGFPDSGDEDSGIVDTGAPDSGPRCVCMRTCGVTADCAGISPTSACNGGVCSGSEGSALCRTDSECSPRPPESCRLTASSELPCN